MSRVIHLMVQIQHVTIFLFDKFTQHFIPLIFLKQTKSASRNLNLQRRIWWVIIWRNKLFWYNFCTTLSSYLYYFLSSLYSFLTLLFLTNEKREQQSCLKGCTKIVVQISLLYYLSFVR